MQRSAVLLSVLLVVAAVGPAVGGVGAAAPVPETRPAFDGTHSETCDFPYTERDATGTEVTIQSAPERVVTLNPSAAQTMWEIGAEAQVVGVSQYASYLDGAEAKANVSGPSGPSVERVLDAEPDVVLVPSSSYGAATERVAQLRAQGVPVFVFGEGTSLEFVANKTERIGRLTGNCEAGVRRAADMRQSTALMERALRDEERALRDEERPVGLNVFFGYTSGADTFIGDVMETGGLRNGAADANVSGFQVINDETVVALDPEWIVVPENSPVPQNAAYNSTTAVQEGNVVVVDTNYLQQPAPRAVIAAETILAAVHPEAYDEYRTLQAHGDDDSTATPTTAARETVTETPTPEPPATTATGTPGFGPALSVVALAAAMVSLAIRRRAR